MRHPKALPSTLLLVTLVVTTSPAPLAGQSGPWWEVAVGAGALRFTCDVCADDRDLGASFRVAGGGYASSSFPVGVEVGWWSHDDAGIRERVYRVGVVGHFYPRKDRRLHVVGGLGWIGYRAGDFLYDAVDLSVGAGWELPLGDGWVVGSRVTLDAASFGALSNGDRRVAGDVGVSLLRFATLLKYR